MNTLPARVHATFDRAVKTELRPHTDALAELRDPAGVPVFGGAPRACHDWLLSRGYTFAWNGWWQREAVEPPRAPSPFRRHLIQIAAGAAAAAALWFGLAALSPARAQHQHAAPVGLSGKVDGWPRIIGVPAGTPPLDAVPVAARYAAITSPDPLSPVAAAADFVTRRAPSTFVLSSSGGDAIAARLAGKYMRLGGHAAIVRTGRTCASACVLVLLSASVVVVERGAGVWTHGLSYGDGNPQHRAELLDMLTRHLRAVLPPGPASEAFIAGWIALPAGAERKLTERELRAIGVRISDAPVL